MPSRPCHIITHRPDDAGPSVQEFNSCVPLLSTALAGWHFEPAAAAHVIRPPVIGRHCSELPEPLMLSTCSVVAKLHGTKQILVADFRPMYDTPKARFAVIQ